VKSLGINVLLPEEVFSAGLVLILVLVLLASLVI